ncbi:urease accessory protein UreE [Pelagicoccus albus]|uniref:Urease accessory protein UreE n=1 Tax=Pelagicoccus albus TaxID=415222 RepID=A0A7X1EAK5_9BACT|nr:urease accessory protein UreE [Pelagicoccus albus]MBC2606862.1 urease accessory protein UreE [Pelagicoccus albus]
MQLITNHLHGVPASKTLIQLPIDRRKLAKRRFRATAVDGAEFGFDLPHPLKHGTAFHETEDSVYLIEQEPEPVLKIPFSEGETGALYGWMVGNMHFPASFEKGYVIAEDDPAVRQLLERANVDFEEATQVFQPAVVASGHHHH